MKKITLFILGLLFSTSLWAENPNFKIEKTLIKGLVNVGYLECFVLVGVPGLMEERINTRLKDVFVIGAKKGQIQVKHGPAIGKGCDLYALDKLKNQAMRTHFGFSDTNVILTKETMIKARSVQGVCRRTIIESLEFDFGNGIVLNTPRKAVFVAAQGCAQQ